MAQESIDVVRQIPRDLRHERFRRVWSDAGEFHASSREIDGEEDALRLEPARRPHLCGQEVHRRHAAPVHYQESAP